MQIDKLIPATKFIIDLSFGYTNGFIPLNEYHSVSLNYAQFLTQPLTLGMFLPCDADGNLLLGKPLSPAADSEWDRWEKEQPIFEEAKSKVLFEGFEYDSIMQKTFNKENGIYADKRILEKGNHTVEFLTDRSPKLTPTAKKLIYGR